MTPTECVTEYRARIRFRTSEPPTDDSLMHYGVKGQKWGVITKEYEPVSIDHRRTGTSMKSTMANRIRRNVAQRSYQRRVQEAKEQRAYIDEARRNNKKVRYAIYGAAALATLLAAYGAYKYVKVTKAKAYSGLLKRFLQQNHGAGLGSIEGQTAFRSGVEKAAANSKTFKEALKTNRYLKSKGFDLKRREALNIYKTRNLMKKVANLKSPLYSSTNKVNGIRSLARKWKIVNKIKL